MEFKKQLTIVFPSQPHTEQDAPPYWSFVRSFVKSFAELFVKSFAELFVKSFAELFVKSFVESFVKSFESYKFRRFIKF